jgi:hypothetical protein
MVMNQYRTDIDCGPGIGQCNVLTEKYNFPEPFWLNLVLLAAIGFVYRCLALLVMHLVSNPKRVHLEKKDEEITIMDKSRQILVQRVD